MNLFVLKFQDVNNKLNIKTKKNKYFNYDLSRLKNL